MKSKYVKHLILFSLILICSKANALEFEIDGLKYRTLSDNEVEVSKGSKTSGTLIIPESVTYNDITYIVTSIGSHAFDGCSGFTGSLTIPNSVTSIGSLAFYGCSGFTELTIGNSVTSIGDYAFEKCSSIIGSLTIPNSVTSIGSEAFNGCSGFTGSLTIGNSVTSIGAAAFAGCSGFTGSLIIPNSVTSIGRSAFVGCSGFTGSLTIPNSVTSIESWVFSGCSSFVGSLTIPNSVTSIGGCAFAGCSGFTGSLTIPNSVTTIGDCAFKNCSSFTELTIPNSVTSIGSEAFSGCSGFTGSLTIPNSVTTIGNNAFNGCSGFTGSLTIPNSVISIKQNAFSGCSGFTGSLTIPNSVTSIGKYAFSGCSGFTGSLTIPNSVTTIEDGAFKNCSSFTELTIPNSVTSIGSEAFSGCSGFTGSLTIPNSVTSIGNNAFNDCSGFTGSLTIPNSVISIGYNAFMSCSGFTGSLTIPNSVTSIGNNAFYGCSAFTGSLTIPNSVTTIGDCVFAGCSGFTGSLTIPNSVTSIGRSAFNGCSGFTGSLTIPNSVTSIGDDAFYNCSGFTGSLTIPNSVTSIGNYAFQACGGLTSITIPNSVKTIGSMAFTDCSKLSTVISEIKEPYIIDAIVFWRISSDATLHIPKGTMGKYEQFSGWTNNFKEFIEDKGSASNVYSLSMKSAGNGSISYKNITTKNKKRTFVLDAGESATINFSSDDGYRIKDAKVNNTDITSQVLSNNQYTINNISENKTLEVEFGRAYTLTIKSTGNGVTTYDGSNIREQSSTFPVTEGTSAVVSFTPDTGYRIKNVKLGYSDVTASVTNNQYTINNINSNTTLEVEYERITFVLSIRATGNGSVMYENTSTRGRTNTFNVVEGSDVTLTITADTDNRIKSVKVDSEDVTSSVKDGKYTISNFRENKTVEVVFEAIPTYSLNILAKGNGNVGYNGNTIRNQSRNYSVKEGSSAILSFTPDSGCRLTNVKLNSTDVTEQVVDGKLTINNITTNTNVEVMFEAINHSLTIKATGNGTATFNGTSIRSKSNQFDVAEGSSATVKFIPDTGYKIKFVLLNGTDVTNSVSNNQYTISSIKGNNTLEVEFEQIILTFTIKATGNGSVNYDGTTIRGKSNSYTIVYGTSATVTFAPDAGYRIKSVKLNTTDVTASVVGGQYTISNIKSDNTLEVEFEQMTYTLSIKSTGSGSVTYNSVVTRVTTNTFDVVEGTDATLTIVADSDNRIKSVKVNSEDVTSSVIDGKYTINNIKSNTSIEVVFEAIPTYSLNITASGNGKVGYDGTNIRNQSQSFTVKEGSSAVLTITPDAGYRIANVKKDNADVTGQISDGKLTINNITSNTSVEVTFEAIPPTTYTLTIKSTGNGTATYDGTSVRGKSSQFTITEGTYATVTFTPDTGYRIKDVKVNNADVTASVIDNQYTINKISANTSLEVEFTEDFKEITIADVNYKVVSYEQQTINLESGDYGLTLTVPATVTAYDRVWNVVGVEADALNTNLAAIIWNPEVEFNGVVSNPNLLLYVKNKQYAPNTIKNVVVNGEAEEITLVDAQSGNNFYCPQAFTAKKVSYEHHYSMTTGYNTCQGWETIVLPFDVATILNATAQEIVPYAIWDESSNLRTFWLYNLTASGWQAANSIKANTPYIISMPNNENYDASYNITGNIQFIGNNVQIKASDNLSAVQSGNKSFVPNYQYQETSSSIYALNVNNQWNTNTSPEAEGSTFIRSLRAVRPFEAYLTVEGGTSAPNYIPVFGNGMPTGIDAKLVNSEGVNSEKWYSLDGRKLQGKPTTKGLYIVNGRKVVVK